MGTALVCGAWGIIGIRGLYSGNGHRHVFSKRKAPKVKRRQQEQNETTIQTKTLTINMDKLKQYTNDLASHASRCGGSVVLSRETRYGLASIITGKCSECEHTVTLETSPKVKGPSKHTR